MLMVDDYAGRDHPSSGRHSVEGFLALVTDETSDDASKVIAIEGLSLAVDDFWFLMAEGLSDLENLASDDKFVAYRKASLLVSKVLFSLEQLEDAMTFAIRAQNEFDVHEQSDYSRSLTAMAVHRYCSVRSSHFADLVEDAETIHDMQLLQFLHSPFRNGMLENLVERLIEESVAAGRLREAIGVCIESRRFDLLRSLLLLTEDKAGHVGEDLLWYAFDCATESVTGSRIVSRLLVDLVLDVAQTKFPIEDLRRVRPHAVRLAQALYRGGRHEALASLLVNLDGTDDDKIAYQICLDIASFEDQPFVTKLIVEMTRLARALRPTPVVTDLPKDTDQQGEPVELTAGSNAARHQEIANNNAPVAETVINATEAPRPLNDEDSTDERQPLIQADGTTPLVTEGGEGDIAQPNLADPASAASDSATAGTASVSGEARESAPTSPTDADAIQTPLQIRLKKLRALLRGDYQRSLQVRYLHRNNRCDLRLLEGLKDAIDSRSSCLMTGVMICHAFMQAGTTNDTFIRHNLDWIGKATFWAKFTAAASTGVLHRSHSDVARRVLSAYLPGSGGGPYSEGGALFGMGLIQANQYRSTDAAYLIAQLNNNEAQNPEPLLHGACLGLGLIAMGTCRPEATAALRQILFSDSAVAGEAAALAMGLVHLGSPDTKLISELLECARDSEHEKIVRAASLGVSFTLYRAEEEAEHVISRMISDGDDQVRYAAMFGIALAYCGSGNSSAVRRLLHAGVSDLSQDVRRAAVIALGFVLAGDQDRLPATVALLTDSFHPHVRYAAALALGIGCAGTANEGVVRTLMDMTRDTAEFVRQAALISLGLLLVEAAHDALPEGLVVEARDLVISIVGSKHENSVTRFGALVGAGLLDAGGRNCTISFYGQTGTLSPESVVGLTLLAQCWFWFPLVLGAALSFKPDCVMRLNPDSQTDESEFTVESSVGPGITRGYNPPAQREDANAAKPAASAVLSTTQKKQRAQLRRFKRGM